MNTASLSPFFLLFLLQPGPGGGGGWFILSYIEGEGEMGRTMAVLS